MKIIDLEKTIGGFTLKTGLLDIEEGQIHGFIGGNGSGKSTLAKLIMGVLEPDGGRIDYEGLSMRDITMTPQRPYLLHDTVYANIVYPLKLRGVRPDREEILGLMETYGLGGKEKQYARSLSSGERQKVSMLRALCFHPRMVMIDETLSNLDPDSVEQFEKWIQRLHKEEGGTWILISHRLSHIARLCQRVHVFAQGRIVESGPTEKMLFHSKDPAVQAYMGRELINEEQWRGKAR